MEDHGDNQDETITLGYYCNICNYTSDSLQEMRTHFSSHNKIDVPFTYIFLEDRKEPKYFEEPLFKCAKCDVFYYTVFEVFKEHWRVEHDIKEPVARRTISHDKNDTFVCDICGKKFFNKLMCELHRKVTLKTTYPLLKRSSTESLVFLNNTTKSFICLICSIDYTSFGHFKRHYGQNHSQEVVRRYMMILKDDNTGYIDHIYKNDRTYACAYCKLEFGRNKLDVISHCKDSHSSKEDPTVRVGYSENGYSLRPESLEDLIREEIDLKCLHKETT